jgi:hypothetical protein
MVRTRRTARKSTGRQPTGQLAPRDVPPQQEPQPDSPQVEEPFEIVVIVPAGGRLARSSTDAAEP